MREGKKFDLRSPLRKYADNFTKRLRRKRRGVIVAHTAPWITINLLRHPLPHLFVRHLYNNNLSCRKCLLDLYAFRYRLPIFDPQNIPDLGPFFRFYDDPIHPNCCIHNFSKDQCFLCLGYKQTLKLWDDDKIPRIDKTYCWYRIHFSSTNKLFRVREFSTFIGLPEDFHPNIALPFRKLTIIDPPPKVNQRVGKFLSKLSVAVNNIYHRHLGEKWPIEKVEWLLASKTKDDETLRVVAKKDIFPYMGLLIRSKKEDFEYDPKTRSLRLHDSFYYRGKGDFEKLRTAIDENWGIKHRQWTWDFRGIIKKRIKKKTKHYPRFIFREMHPWDEWHLSPKIQSDICYRDIELIKPLTKWKETGRWQHKNEKPIVKYSRFFASEYGARINPVGDETIVHYSPDETKSHTIIVRFNPADEYDSEYFKRLKDCPLTFCDKSPFYPIKWAQERMRSILDNLLRTEGIEENLPILLEDVWKERKWKIKHQPLAIIISLMVHFMR